MSNTAQTLTGAATLTSTTSTACLSSESRFSQRRGILLLNVLQQQGQRVTWNRGSSRCSAVSVGSKPSAGPALCHALLQPGALTRHLLPKPGNSASSVKLSLICLSCSTVYSRTNFRKTSSFQPDHPRESSPHPQVLYSFCLEAEEPKLEESPNCVCDKQKKNL